MARRSSRILPPISSKAWQRTIRERHGQEDSRPPLASTDGCVIEPIPHAEAAPFILKYEWLGTMGRSTVTYGMRAPDGELIGVTCFGWPGAVQSRDICGPMVPDESDPKGRREKSVHREIAICLERGACSHRAPSNGASFLISRSVTMAARDGGWRIFYAYADPEAGEIGTVYQACNWLYLGQGVGRANREPSRQDWFIPEDTVLPEKIKDGKIIPARTVKGGRTIASRTLRDLKVTIKEAEDMEWVEKIRHPKHKYVHFEGSRTERKALLGTLRYPPKPYPKRDS